MCLLKVLPVSESFINESLWKVIQDFITGNFEKKMFHWWNLLFCLFAIGENNELPEYTTPGAKIWLIKKSSKNVSSMKRFFSSGKGVCIFPVRIFLPQHGLLNPHLNKKIWAWLLSRIIIIAISALFQVKHNVVQIFKVHPLDTRIWIILKLKLIFFYRRFSKWPLAQ